MSPEDLAERLARYPSLTEEPSKKHRPAMSSISAHRLVEVRKLPPSLEAQPELVDNLCERCVSHFCSPKGTDQERRDAIEAGCARSTPEAKCTRCRGARHDCKEVCLNYFP